MPITLSAVPKGYQFPPVSFDLSPAWVDGYVAAAGDSAVRALGPDIVPPMALAALSIRALLETAGLPPGSIHLGQEAAFHRPVRTGERLEVRAEVVSRGERQEFVLMGVDLRVDGSSGEAAMTGRATVTFPLEQPS
jgi:acyl dehydratase